MVPMIDRKNWEWMEVSDDGKHWEKRRVYMTFVDGSCCVLYHSDVDAMSDEVFRHCRPCQPKRVPLDSGIDVPLYYRGLGVTDANDLFVGNLEAAYLDSIMISKDRYTLDQCAALGLRICFSGGKDFLFYKEAE